jgi:hypothetical protein
LKYHASKAKALTNKMQMQRHNEENHTAIIRARVDRTHVLTSEILKRKVKSKKQKVKDNSNNKVKDKT